MAKIFPDAVPVGNKGEKVRLTDPRELGKVRSAMCCTKKLFSSAEQIQEFINTNGLDIDRMVDPTPELRQQYCTA